MATIQLMGRTDQGNTPDRGALQAYYNRILAAERARGAGILPAIASNAEEPSKVSSARNDRSRIAGKMPTPREHTASKIRALQRKRRTAEVDDDEVLRPRATPDYFTSHDRQLSDEKTLLRDPRTLAPGPAEQFSATGPVMRCGRPSRLYALAKARVLRRLALHQICPQASVRLKAQSGDAWRGGLVWKTE